MKNILTTAILAIAAAATAATAQAGTTSYTDGDLLLGIVVPSSASPNFSSDYVVDLGQPGAVYNALIGGGSIIFSWNSAASTLGNVNQDLINTFGANWNSRTDILFSVVGCPSGSDNVPADAADTVYTTNPNATSYLRRADSTVQSGTAANIGAAGGGYDQNPTSANTDVGLVQSASGPSSYAGFQPGNNTNFSESGGISFTQFSPNNEGKPSQTLYFDRLVPTISGTAPGQTLGTVTIDNTGVTFTAVPEPSAALMLIPLAGFLSIVRRRNVTA